jgi:hypothetical protein
MNAKPSRAKRSEYAQIPESVRKAYETAGTAAWISAQEKADEKAEAVWRARCAELEKQLAEMTAVCAVHAEAMLALRAKLIDVETKAAASASAARDVVANFGRRLTEMTEEAQRALKCAGLVASQAAELKVVLDGAQTSAERFAGESDVAQQMPIAGGNSVDPHAVESESSNYSILAAASHPPPASGEWSHLNRADVIEAANIILTAASRLQAIGAIAESCREASHIVCGCHVEKSVCSDSPVGQDHHEI